MVVTAVIDHDRAHQWLIIADKAINDDDDDDDDDYSDASAAAAAARRLAGVDC